MRTILYKCNGCGSLFPPTKQGKDSADSCCDQGSSRSSQQIEVKQLVEERRKSQEDKK